jgi:hypothetical protein
MILLIFSKILADTFSEDPNIKNYENFGNKVRDYLQERDGFEITDFKPFTMKEIKTAVMRLNTFF